MMIAAIDVGLKRIGLSLSPDGVHALPQPAIFRKNREQAARDVSRFLREWGVAVLVVGIPKGGSSEEEMTRRIRHFISLLDYKGEIFYEDESDTSLEAWELLKGKVRLERDGRIDSLAASLLLERFLKKKRS